jgi:hypothetical protein
MQMILSSGARPLSAIEVATDVVFVMSPVPEPESGSNLTIDGALTDAV